MAAPVYTYMVHDLLTNIPLGDLPLTGVSYGKRLNDSGAASGSFHVENRRDPRRIVRDPYDLTTPCKRCVYIYRDDVPQWGGIIWTRRYDSRTRTVQLGLGDWWTYYDHRKILPLLPTNPAVRYTVAEMVARFGHPAPIDQNAIARGLLALAHQHPGGNLGVVADPVDSLITRERTYRGYELGDVGEALRQLAGVQNGPDLLFDVDRQLGADGRPVRRLRLGDPGLGQQGSAWVFEYGGNVVDYTWPSDGTRYASRVLAAGEGMVEGTPIAVAESTDGYPTGWPLVETERGYSTVSDPSVLQAHADADLQAARRPVVLPQLEVRGERWPMVGEWNVGDDARVVIEDDWLPDRVDTLARIVAADMTPPEGDADEKVVLTMSPLLDDIA